MDMRSKLALKNAVLTVLRTLPENGWHTKATVLEGLKNNYKVNVRHHLVSRALKSLERTGKIARRYVVNSGDSVGHVGMDRSRTVGFAGVGIADSHSVIGSGGISHKDPPVSGETFALGSGLSAPQQEVLRALNGLSCEWHAHGEVAALCPTPSVKNNVLFLLSSLAIQGDAWESRTVHDGAAWYCKTDACPCPAE
jgi:hypothetical protein